MGAKMKNSVIIDILNGVKGNRQTMVLSKTNKDNLKKISDGYDKLKSRLNSKQMKLLEKFLDVYDNNYLEEIDFYYLEGFKLGLLLAVECFKE